MISYGENIRSAADSLKKMSVDTIANIIKTPSTKLEHQIRQLRILREVDPKKYSAQKTILPYIVCSIFDPPFRKRENFAYTEYFIIDIDNISQMDLLIFDLKERLIRDSRTLLIFESPSGDGLKIMLRLSERCYDAGRYSIFYRDFCREFANQYHLETAVDIKTSDVARACFLSCDTSAYFNPDSTPVVLADHIRHDRIEITNKIEVENHSTYTGPTEPDDATINAIRSTLNLNRRVAAEKPPVVVPEILENIEDNLKQYIENKGLTVSDIIDIQYGKKIKATLGCRNSEVNLFYGKKGFSIVKATKTGTSMELNQLLLELVQSYLLDRT